jgi:hypothetical protein
MTDMRAATFVRFAVQLRFGSSANDVAALCPIRGPLSAHGVSSLRPQRGNIRSQPGAKSGGQDKEVGPRGAYQVNMIHEKWDPHPPIEDPRCG